MDIQDARQLAAAQDYASAQKLLKQILTREPKNVEAWLVLADVVQKPEISKKCLQQVLKIDPGNPVALQKLHQPEPNVQQVEADPAPRSQNEHINDVTQPSNEMDDPWEISSQVSLTFESPPQSHDDPLQGVTQPSMQISDPWENTAQVVSTSTPPTETFSTADPLEKHQDSIAMSQKPKKSGRWLEFSLIGVLVVMMICVLGLFLFWPDNADQSSASEAATSPEDPLAVIFANIRASNAESLPHYMATIHSNSPVYQSTKEMTAEAFDLFDLSYQISGLKITEQTRNEVVVVFTLTTRKIRGPSFRDNRINGDMVLRKEGDRWKIYNQVVHDVKYLN